MNDDTPSGALRRIADAVADGAPVDWDRERSKAPELRAELDSLRVLAKIAAAPASAETGPTLEANGTDGARDPIGASATQTAGGSCLFTWGSLRILEELGSGSFGHVYRAFDPNLEVEVALKLRKAGATDDSESVARYLEEARRMARVRHPSVATVYGAAVHDGRVGIWMELVSGETLEHHLERRGVLGAREAAGIGIELCRALAAVHEAGVIHRDVKTNNVMRDVRGRIVLMDFGSGSELPRSGVPFETRHVHGTPLFMAPEQLSGTIAGPATDIYGLGVVLYRLVSKKFPIYADSLPELALLHQADPVPLLDYRPDLPTEFIRVVHKAIARRPEDRYGSSGAMQLALERAMQGSVAAPREAENSAARPRRRWWIVAVPAAIVATAAVLLAIRKPEPPSPPGPAVTSTTVLSANASVFRHTATGDELLMPGERVRPNDLLSMEVQSSAPMHLYVLAEDARGEVYVLFPNPTLILKNPLPSGERYRLPGRSDDGNVRYWNVTSAGQRESIVAIGSRRPLPKLEREIARFPNVGSSNQGRVSEETVEFLRGIGGLSVGPNPPDRSEPGSLSEAIARGVQTGSKDSLWTWYTQFENPDP